MRAAVLGCGGREHALQWALNRDPDVEIVFALPGNGGTDNRVAIDPGDSDAVRKACDEKAIDLLVVGPEAPLSTGIVDAFRERRTRVVGPTQSAARLESSKIWAKAFMTRQRIPTAEYTRVGSRTDLASFAARHRGSVVLKADGLAGGKGVSVCRSSEDIDREWLRITALRPPEERYVAEERLEGWELSVHVLTDGSAWCLLPTSQDHKQLLDGDRGPNTGGMGAYSPVAACDSALMDRIVREIVEPTIVGLGEEGISYRGFLYFGLMITDSGPKVLEYNVRLGDPETQVLVPAILSGLSAALVASVESNLAADALEFGSGSRAGVVLASAGYPTDPKTGKAIRGLGTAAETALVFHAGTETQGAEVRTSGGRVLAVVGRGEHLEEALERAYTGCRQVSFDGMHFRTDIGRRESR